ncbi:MAG: RNA polymerase sigma factor for flagellar operon FliA, partial [Bradymonadia bacterium]
LSRLPEDERHILVSHYIKDLTLAEIAREMGVSRSWACRLHARAITNARALAESDEPKKRHQHATSG